MLNEKEIDELIIYISWEAFQGMDYANPLDVEIAIRSWFRLHQPDRLSPEGHFEETFDDYLKNPGKYFRRKEDDLINEMLSDSQDQANK